MRIKSFNMVSAAPVAVCASGGALFAAAFPRGPQDGPSVVLGVAGALIVGGLAGRLASTPRWLCCIAAWLAYEIVRWPLAMPTTDPPSPRLFGGSSFAVGALVLGRGVDALVGLVPLWVGLGLFRRRAPRGWSKFFAGVGVVALALSLGTLVPASTPRVPGGFAEVARVRLGDCEHRLVIRGAGPGHRVLFFLSGGPGGTEIGTLHNQWAGIERDFTVVVWDQTGAGLNARCFPRDGRLTLERLLRDAEGVVAYVNHRFGRPVTLVGNSWGTFLGVLLVRDRPDLVASYVGSGQMVALSDTDLMFYDDTIEWGRTHGRVDVAEELVAQGPPPYASIYPYEETFAHEGDWGAWERTPEVGAAVNPLTNVMDKPELDPIAKVRYPANVIDSFSVLYPQVQGIDFRRDAASLRVPVTLAQGVHEARGRAVPARDWFDRLEAPSKEWVDFERSGHKAFGEEPEAFGELVRRVAR